MSTVVYPLIGGALIGLAAAAMWMLNGRIAGISGIVGGAINIPRGETVWRLFFVAGLLAGGALLAVVRPDSFPTEIAADTPVLLIAGLLVGFGTQLGSGCTSGHGVCGTARLSPRSLAATATFIAVGAATVVVARLLGRGGNVS
jgi:uncharacterized membrane protein YedE/YeeE